MKILQFSAVVILIFTQNCFAQKKLFKIPDSLKSKSINYIIERMEENENNESYDSIYAYTYLLQSKAAKDYENLYKAYNIVMFKSKKETWLQYCDSMLTVAKRLKDNELMGSSYLTRGTVYYWFKQETKALDNYIMADGFLSKTNNQYLKFKTKYSIAQIKYFLGYYDEAISLLKECEDYFRENAPGRPHLNTLHSLSLCYTKTKQYDLATATSDLGYREAIDIDEPSMIPYFMNASGQNEYFKKNYKVAIEKLRQSLPDITKAKDFANLATTNFYIGRSYWALGEKEKAIPFLKKVDEAFQKEKFIKEDLLEAYILLAQYYKAKGNPSEQLRYLTSLLEAETFVSNKFKYLAVNMHRKYDLKKIVEETEELKRHLFFRNKMDIIFAIIFLLVTATFTYIFCKQYQRRKIRKQRFKNLISQKIKKVKPLEIKDKIIDGEQIIKPEIISAVSKKLEKFEESDLYLDKDFNLSKMAAFVDCNTRYTSRIISETRNKKYIEYVDDLRIEYIVDQLKNDSKFRNYTIKALTEEAGFKSPQKFKEAFTKATELTPLYFIKELKKQDSKQ
jgi:AraC-like DNA-binding protein